MRVVFIARDARFNVWLFVGGLVVDGRSSTDFEARGDLFWSKVEASAWYFNMVGEEVRVGACVFP